MFIGWQRSLLVGLYFLVGRILLWSCGTLAQEDWWSNTLELLAHNYGARYAFKAILLFLVLRNLFPSYTVVCRQFSMIQKNSFYQLTNQATRSARLSYPNNAGTISSLLSGFGNNEGCLQIVVWDAQTTERVAKLPSTHNGAPRWIEYSPIEAAFVSCGTDRAVRYWKEVL